MGVINNKKVNAFERVLWRVCRRTAFLRNAEIEDDLENPDTVIYLFMNFNKADNFQGEKIRESVFIIFYSGDRLRLIIDRVLFYFA